MSTCRKVEVTIFTYNSNACNVILVILLHTYEVVECMSFSMNGSSFCPCVDRSRSSNLSVLQCTPITYLLRSSLASARGDKGDYIALASARGDKGDFADMTKNS